MLPQTLEELISIRTECHIMVKKRAIFAAAASSLPFPGFDISCDVAILLELIPAINRKYGLSPEQIAGYSPKVKQIIFQVIKRAGLAMIGAEITRTLLTQTLKRVAGRGFTRQVLKFVPIIGWSANAAIGFGAMLYVGNSHARDCFNVCKNVIDANDNNIEPLVCR